MKQESKELVDRIIPVLMSVYTHKAFNNIVDLFKINESPNSWALNNRHQPVALCARSGFSGNKTANLMNYLASPKG
ncbi:hypothetical protein [Serratia sp. M24T3]|uniref:hypothetical protein n=1 Tax=Serratia sp. M24T3 TaxID=932213 RepID=UPI00025B92F2|nr:hypothetical protein [Serratia sp. M24T3]EIC85462.1 hypothetical protein SPM24T3_06353 [Serratia sp. M24T3]